MKITSYRIVFAFAAVMILVGIRNLPPQNNPGTGTPQKNGKQEVVLERIPVLKGMESAPIYIDDIVEIAHLSDEPVDFSKITYESQLDGVGQWKEWKEGGPKKRLFPLGSSVIRFRATKLDLVIIVRAQAPVVQR